MLTPHPSASTVLQCVALWSLPEAGSGAPAAQYQEPAAKPGGGGLQRKFEVGGCKSRLKLHASKEIQQEHGSLVHASQHVTPSTHARCQPMRASACQRPCISIQRGKVRGVEATSCRNLSCPDSSLPPAHQSRLLQGKVRDVKYDFDSCRLAALSTEPQVGGLGRAGRECHCLFLGILACYGWAAPTPALHLSLHQKGSDPLLIALLSAWLWTTLAGLHQAAGRVARPAHCAHPQPAAHQGGCWAWR